MNHPYQRGRAASAFLDRCGAAGDMFIRCNCLHAFSRVGRARAGDVAAVLPAEVSWPCGTDRACWLRGHSPRAGLKLVLTRQIRKRHGAETIYRRDARVAGKTAAVRHGRQRPPAAILHRIAEAEGMCMDIPIGKKTPRLHFHEIGRLGRA